MPEEVIRFLSPRPGGVYLDGTLGGGGHAQLIAERCTSNDGALIGFDQDREALAVAAERLSRFGKSVRLIHGNFSGAADFLNSQDITGIDGFVLDLGVSSHQLDVARRGFSFQSDGVLDMRMDSDAKTTAADLVNTLPEQELERIFREYGEERWAKRVAAFIIKERAETAIETTFRLAEIIKNAIPRATWEKRLHPATRTFQALRIAVNHELESLDHGLRGLIDCLKPGGRGVVISFHSLEDRIAKNIFREYAAGCVCPRGFPVCVCGGRPRISILTGKPVMAASKEVMENPRSRGAKLRAIEKLQ